MLNIFSAIDIALAAANFQAYELKQPLRLEEATRLFLDCMANIYKNFVDVNYLLDLFAQALSEINDINIFYYNAEDFFNKIGVTLSKHNGYFDQVIDQLNEAYESSDKTTGEFARQWQAQATPAAKIDCLMQFALHTCRHQQEVFCKASSLKRGLAAMRLLQRSDLNETAETGRMLFYKITGPTF